MSDRRAAILHHAADLIAERGYSAVGVQEIGAGVGVTGAAIYRHFESKDAILDTLLLSTAEEWFAATQAPVADGQDRLDTVIAEALRLVQRHPNQLATYLRERGRARFATLRKLNQLERSIEAGWRDAIAPHRPDDRDVGLRMQVINGALQSLSRRSDELASARFQRVVHAGLRAVALAPIERAASGPAGRSWRSPQSRRRDITLAAARLFAERGYHGVGIDEIGAAVGISGPAVYEHFSSKAELLLDIYDFAGALTIARTVDAVESAASADAALDALVRDVVEITHTWRDAMIVSAREARSLPPVAIERLRRRRHEIYDAWIGVVREVRPELPLSDVIALVRAVLPMVIQVAEFRRPRPLPVEQTSTLISAFVRGRDVS